MKVKRKRRRGVEIRTMAASCSGVTGKDKSKDKDKANDDEDKVMGSSGIKDSKIISIPKDKGPRTGTLSAFKPAHSAVTASPLFPLFPLFPFSQWAAMLGCPTCLMAPCRPRAQMRLPYVRERESERERCDLPR